MSWSVVAYCLGRYIYIYIYHGIYVYIYTHIIYYIYNVLCLGRVQSHIASADISNYLSILSMYICTLMMYVFWPVQSHIASAEQLESAIRALPSPKGYQSQPKTGGASGGGGGNGRGGDGRRGSSPMAATGRPDLRDKKKWLPGSKVSDT